MNLHDYLINHEDFDWPTLLVNWHWLLPPKFNVWLLTRTGDLFITLPDGSIHMLDVGAGQLNKVAENREDACTKIDDPQVAADWLMIPVVDQLVAGGLVVGPNQCYSYKMLPVLGGNYAAEGRAILPISEHFSGWGTVQRQIADLPDGSEARIKATD